MTKKVVRISATGERVVFPSVSAAVVATDGIPRTTLFRMLSNGKKTGLGSYDWNYLDASPPRASKAAVPEPGVDPTTAPAERGGRPFEALKTDDGRFITEMRLRDGFVNATRMCHGAKKEWSDYIRLNATKNFMQSLSTSIQVASAQLIKQVMTGPSHRRGTWIHPLMATHLAYWCSADFAVKVSRWVEEYKAINPKACKEWTESIFNLKADKHAVQERRIRDKLRADLGGDTEVACHHGRADLVTHDTVVEIKRVDKYLHALGQVLGYGRCMPEKRKRVHLFGDVEEDSEIVKRAKALVESFDVQCTYETVKDVA